MIRLRLGVSALVGLFLAAGLLVGQEKDKKPEVEPKKSEIEPSKKLKGFLPANFKKLGLSEEQIQKIYRIQADYRDKIADLEKQKKELKNKEKADIRKVLTPAQQARLREIQDGGTP